MHQVVERTEMILPSTTDRILGRNDVNVERLLVRASL